MIKFWWEQIILLCCCLTNNTKRDINNPLISNNFKLKEWLINSCDLLLLIKQVAKYLHMFFSRITYNFNKRGFGGELFWTHPLSRGWSKQINLHIYIAYIIIVLHINCRQNSGLIFYSGFITLINVAPPPPPANRFSDSANKSGWRVTGITISRMNTCVSIKEVPYLLKLYTLFRKNEQGRLRMRSYYDFRFSQPL
jgi:hypothetical protein